MVIRSEEIVCHLGQHPHMSTIRDPDGATTIAIVTDGIRRLRSMIVYGVYKSTECDCNIHGLYSD